MAANIISFIFILFLLVVPLANYAFAGDFCYNWQTNLYYGLRGDNDVMFLQTALKKEGVFPFLEDYITGNFFNLTLNSVKEFQKKYGIENTGFVGPLTRGQLNKIYNCGSVATTTPISKTAAPKITEIIPPSGEIGATITLKGSGFSSSTNRLYIGYDVLENVKSENNEIKFVFSPPIPEEVREHLFPLPFGFYVENENGTSNEGKFTFETAKTSASLQFYIKKIIFAAIRFLSEEKTDIAQATVLRPFGGRILYTYYCCNGVLEVIGPPQGGSFLFTTGSMLYSYYQVYRPGPWTLGDAYPYGSCQTGYYCSQSIPAFTIRQEGTSLK